MPPREIYTPYNEEELPYMEVIIMWLFIIFVIIMLVMPFIQLGMMIYEVIEMREFEKQFKEMELEEVR